MNETNFDPKTNSPLQSSGGLSQISQPDQDYEIRKGDLVGDVVWQIVSSAIRNADPGSRITFMLTGMSYNFLMGVARNAPDGMKIQERSLKFVINPEATENRTISPPAEMSYESPVHWRHSTAADVIVFVPSDTEREGIGAGLGPIARIDGQRVVDETKTWWKKLADLGHSEYYLKPMLEGLRRSKIYIDLDMWVDFILALMNQSFGLPVDKRVQYAAPALHIPKDGLAKLPKFKTGAVQNNITVTQFRRAFQIAQSEVSCYVSLLNRRQDPVDTQKVREIIDQMKTERSFDDDHEEYSKALEAAESLIADESNIRPGKWRKSQKEFCETVSWERIGSRIFAVVDKAKKIELGKRTLEYIEGNYPEVAEDDRNLLISLSDRIPSEPRYEELDFFERWREPLNHPKAIRLFNHWQRRLFHKEVIGRDLISTLYRGFQELVNVGLDEVGKIRDSHDEPMILVRTTQHGKAMFWEELDQHVHELFRFELKSIQEMTKSRIKWDLDACFKHISNLPQSSINRRKVDLELYLVKSTHDGNPPKSTPRVKATWKPGLKTNDEPISLALWKDVIALADAAKHGKGMFRNLEFAPLTGEDHARITTTTLSNINTFSDVSQNQNGRMFDPTVSSDDDILEQMQREIKKLTDSYSLPKESAEMLSGLVDKFKNLYQKAIELIANDPQKGFESELVDRQANAFGELCRACRQHVTSSSAQKKLRSLVAQIGILTSSGSDSMVILTAWHPLRLAERRAKIKALAVFIDSVLKSPEADLTIAFEQQQMVAEQWFFPQVAVVEDTTFISIEDVLGYSLMVPADETACNVEKLERSTPVAASKFMYGVEQYLDVYPHQASNLSATIYDAESLSLPQEIARELAKKIHSDPTLRCDLVISHHNQERLRQIYQNQNMRLAAEKISETAKGFLSRLRVDVKSSRTGGGNNDSVPDVDLIFLQDVVSSKAKSVWEHEPVDSTELKSDFDFDNILLPRRCQLETDSSRVGSYLTMPRSPQAVAEYQNLLYEMVKKAILPIDHHGVLIREVDSNDPQLKRLMNDAHHAAEWVVSYDTMSSRALLEACSVKIIQDISSPGSDERVIISAREVKKELRDNVKLDLIRTGNFKAEIADGYARKVLDQVLQISGQKVLSAAQNGNASKEIIGLSVMKIHMESSLAAYLGKVVHPIWISLDDYRSWFTTGTGKIADAVSIAIVEGSEGFEIFVQVGEAKFVQMRSSFEIEEAKRQVRETVNQFRTRFIDNTVQISRNPRCTQLLELLVNRDRLSTLIPDPKKRGIFQEHLCGGKVSFRISGEAIVCLHDHHEYEPTVEQDPEQPYLRYHKLPTPTIRTVLKAMNKGESLLGRIDLGHVRWYPDNTSDLAHHLQNSHRVAVYEKAESRQNKTLEIERNAYHVDAIEPAIDVEVKMNEVIGSDREPSSTAEQKKSEPNFIPEPVFLVLNKLAAREKGTISDPDSIKWAQDIKHKTQRALSRYGMHAEFSEPACRLTPNAVLLTFRGHESLTVEKVRRKSSELLTTHGIDILDIQPGPGQISLSVKRPQRAKVHLASTWLQAEWPDRELGDMTGFILGQREDVDRSLFLNIAGEFADYQEHGPHSLIAGGTGSGKGILIQGLLLQMITFNNPRNLDIIIIDPKMGVDFNWIRGAPHLRRPVLSNIDEAQEVFEELLSTMDERYRKIRKLGVQNISQYNQQVFENERIPRIFLIHDEMGAWMATEGKYRDTILSAVSRLGMEARAAGIHLILITQRADKDAVPPRLRDNLGNRLCLKVNSVGGSEIVLGNKGAEKLLGKGHMACELSNQDMPTGHNFFLVQVPFAEPEEIQELAKAAISYWRRS